MRDRCGQHGRVIAVALALLAAGLTVLGDWGPPKLVLHIPSPGKFQGVDHEGNYMFFSAPTVTVVDPTGKTLRTLSPPSTYMFEALAKSKGRFCGYEAYDLGSSRRILVMGCWYDWIIDYEGHIVRVFRAIAQGGPCVIYPDGRFVMYAETNDPRRLQHYQVPGKDMMNNRYFLYSPDGEYLGEIDKPPVSSDTVDTLVIQVAPILKDDTMKERDAKSRDVFLFPDKSYTMTIPGRFGEMSTVEGGITDFGWVSAGGAGDFAFDHEGRVIARMPSAWPTIRDLWTKIEPTLDPKPRDVHEQYMDDEHALGRWDQYGNFYYAVTCFYPPERWSGASAGNPTFDGGDIYLFKIPWIPGDDKPLTPPPIVTPLNGFGEPLPDKPGPPTLDLKGDAGPDGTPPQTAVLTFLFPPQDIWMESPLYPVYSLWDYQLSAYQREHPGAILGFVAVTPDGRNASSYNAPSPAPDVTLDFNAMARDECDCIGIHVGGLVPFSGVAEPILYGQPARGPHGRHLYAEYTFLDKDAYEKHNGSWTSRVYFDPRSGDHLFTTPEPDGGDVLNFDPKKPDVLHPTLSVPIDLWSGARTFIETGDDTKVFIPPYVMTRLTLTPATWPSSERATILVDSRNWRDGGKADTERLTETAPGSMRFVNADGTVIYEITHIMDVDKRLVPATSPDMINYLYLYITDPKIGLNHAPQMLFELGENVGKYRSFAEPDPQLINFPYGSWPYKPWTQVSEEIQKAQFMVEVSGIELPEHTMLRVTWDGPDGKPESADDPLVPEGGGKYKTAIPLLCFTDQGCDIGGTWDWTKKIPTPQIPGVITFRQNNVTCSFAAAP